ncbi:MAG: NERD domain-containing protein [Desulfobacteraceae bacterium]|nr:NERD domain-containing protein [Desulfobacteraceae bacterium]
MNFLLAYFPIILFFGIFAIFASVLYLLRKSRQIKGHRSPFKDNFLRSPGESLNRQIMEINDRLTENLVLLITMPILFYATYISSLHFGNLKLSTSTFTIYIIAGIGFIAYCLFKLIKLLKLRRSYRLGYEGEIAVGQELNQLMRDGYYVYHDFPAGKFNIDHIVVGPSGVFAVETKARSKPTSKDRKADAKVKYDGKSLRFPNGTDVESLDQAKRQAEWLSKWLRSAVGEAVRVRPVVALPGWFVERVASGGIRVINPKNFRSIAKTKDGNILSEQMISRIVHQLEQKCRDVEPRQS